MEVQSYNISVGDGSGDSDNNDYGWQCWWCRWQVEVIVNGDVNNSGSGNIKSNDK